ncbi:hypothetical protein DRQ50_06750 [bacterium]|nr:MAG: hypothetical protein DRQ50_06750 [bacterium]
MNRILIACVLLLAMVAAVEAAVPEPGGTAAMSKARDLEAVQTVALTLPPRAELAAEDAAAAAAGELYRFALPEAVALTPDNAGTWQTLADGRLMWRLRITVQDALSLNLGFTHYGLPFSGRLALYPADRPGEGLVFDAGDNAYHGQLWTPIMATDDLVVELTVDSLEAGRVDLEIGAINRGYRSLGGDPTDKAGACNIDIVCPEGDEWRREAASVAVYSVLGSRKCTGALINNTTRDGRPFFLTASHCNILATWAPSVTLYWNFESPVCGGHSGGSLADSQSGTTLRANWGGDDTADMTLIELDDIPPDDYAVIYAGWNRTDTAPASAVAIHHPETDEKSISFDDDPLTITSYGGSIAPGDGTHLRIGAWELGTTEVGSSGSPLFGPDHLIVGQLHGGFAACGVLEPDWYGRVQSSWNGGGNQDSRLRDWLDPADTGAVTLEALEPDRASIAVRPGDDVVFSGLLAGPFEPSSTTWTIVSTGTLPVDWTVTTDAPWLQLSSAGGTLVSGAEVTVTGIPVATDDLATGNNYATVSFVNTTSGGGDTDVDVNLVVGSISLRILHVAPNPAWGPADIVYQVGGDMEVHIRFYDLRGMLVADLGAVRSTTGENVYQWSGRDPEGKALPGGVYILEIEGGGQKDRMKIAQTH